MTGHSWRTLQRMAAPSRGALIVAVVFCAGGVLFCSGTRTAGPGSLSTIPPPVSAPTATPRPAPPRAAVLESEVPREPTPAPDEPAPLFILSNASASPTIESPKPARSRSAMEEPLPPPVTDSGAPADSGNRPARPSAPSSPSPRQVFTLPSGATIELGGIVYSEDDPLALLNGRVRRVGDSVEGCDVIAIGPNSVELLRGKEKIVLRLD